MDRPAIVGCGLYVHVPFCTTKCGYCDFYSVRASGRDTSRLVRCVTAELDRRLPSARGPVTTIFVGGGTPTVLPDAELRNLLTRLVPVATATDGVEFTVEANPATLTDVKLRVLREAGVSRLSLGAQSFSSAELGVLERIHSPEDIAPAVRAVRAGGIGNINLDLIFGIPGQSMASWCESLDRAMALEPDHLALYALSYEGGTALARRRELGQVRPCDEELEADMYRTALERVGGHGYEQYEISNFARPGCRCRHNLAYWDHQPYVGVGPSAVGYLDGVRYRNVPDIARYVELMDRQGDAVVERECIRGRGLAAEMAMLRLRLNEGIDVARFEGRTSLDPHVVFAGAIRRFERMGLIEATATRIALTDSGRLYADTIIADFMSELDLVPASNVAGTRCDTTP